MRPIPSPPTLLHPGEHLHVDRARGFQVIRPVGWRVAGDAEVRATYDSRNWRRREYAPTHPIESVQLPALTLTVGPRHEPLAGDTVLIEVRHESDADWSALDHVTALIDASIQWVHFDAHVLEAPTSCIVQGLPAARATMRYTVLAVAGIPALCQAHIIVSRRGSDLIAVAVARIVDGGVSAPGKTLDRLLASLRILERAERYSG